MKILGITGGIGAGKSAVAHAFERLGAAVVDADKIAHAVMEPGGAAFLKVVSAFGHVILMPDGTIDRKKLAAMVFQNSDRLALLNEITHPCVFEEMQMQIANCKAPLVCLDVPLLFSCDFPIPCDKTLAVIAKDPVRLARVMERDGSTKTQVEQRMRHQLSQQEMEKRADLVLDNSGTVQELEQKVKEIYQEIME